MTIAKFQKGMATKLYRQEFWFLCSECHLMMLYISMKFHEKISWRVFKLYSGREMTTVKFQRGITTKLYRQELWFLRSACHLLMLYTSMKFYENILKGFQVIEQTWNDHCQISKGNNYKTVQKSYSSCVLHVFWWCLYFYEFSWQYLERFSSYRVDTKLPFSNFKRE